MKSLNLEYEDFLENHLETDEKYSDILVQIYTSEKKEEVIERIVENVKKKLPDAKIFGVRSENLIFNGQLRQKGTFLNLSFFRDTEIRIDLIDKELTMFDEYRNMIDCNTRNIILVSSMEHMDTEVFLNHFSEQIGDISVSGGVNGDFDENLTYIFDGNRVINDGILICQMINKNLNTEKDYGIAWNSMRASFTITSSNINRVRQLDSKPVMEVLEENYGREFIEKIPFSSNNFPFIMEKDGLEICRTIDYVSKECMFFSGQVYQDEKIHLGISNKYLLLENVREKINKEYSFKPDVINVFSCMNRAFILDKKINCELEFLNSIAPTIGFYAHGEFYSHLGKIHIFNEALTYLFVSEDEREFVNSEKVEHNEKLLMLLRRNNEKEYYKTMINLVNSITDNLIDKNRELEEASLMDPLTGIGNRRMFTKYLMENLTNDIFCEHNLGLIIIDIDCLKQFNDTYGHLEGDILIRTLAQLIHSIIGNKGIVIRYGGDEFVVLISKVTENELNYLNKKLIREVENLKIENQNAYSSKYVSISTGINIIPEEEISLYNYNNIIKIADQALYKEKRNKKSKKMGEN